MPSCRAEYTRAHTQADIDALSDRPADISAVDRSHYSAFFELFCIKSPVSLYLIYFSMSLFLFLLFQERFSDLVNANYDRSRIIRDLKQSA
jgi:hypothetical protein